MLRLNAVYSHTVTSNAEQKQAEDIEADKKEEEQDANSSSFGASDSLDITEISALAETARKLLERGKGEGPEAGIGRSVSEEVMGSRKETSITGDGKCCTLLFVCLFVCMFVCLYTVYHCTIVYTESAHSKSAELSTTLDTSR